MREIRMLRSTRRGLETWHGRDTVTPRNRKGEATGNTNFDLNRRASPRPYRRAGRVKPFPTPIPMTDATSPCGADGQRKRCNALRLLHPTLLLAPDIRIPSNGTTAHRRGQTLGQTLRV